MPPPPTDSGFTTLLLLPALFVAIKLWSDYVGRRMLGALPVCPDVFEAVADDLVPADSREILEAHAAPLFALGFTRLGFLRVTDDLVPETRTRLVLRHEQERVVAILGVGLLGGELGVACDLMTFYEDGSWLCTENGRIYQHFGLAASGRYADALVATFYAQWQAHRAAIGTRLVVEIDLTTLAARLSNAGDEALQGAIARGEIALDSRSGRPLRTAHGVRQTYARIAAGRASAARAKLTTGDFKLRRLPVEDQQRFFAELVLMRELRRRAASPWVVLGLTAAGFALSTFLTMDVTWIVLLMPALLFHELGHWSVMRLCGHRDARIAFVPLLGAVTMTQRPFAKRWQEVAMLLAGPLPGLVLGLALTIPAMTHGWTRVSHVALMLIGLNALNLLPLQPLDGGRIFHVLVAAGRPLLDLALRAIATGLFVVLALKLGDPTLGLLGLAGVFVLRTGYRNQAVEKKIRAAPDYDFAWPEPERRRRIFAALADAPERRMQPWFESASALDLAVRTRRPPLWQSLFWMGSLAAVVGGGAFVVHEERRFKDEVACPRSEQGTSVTCGDSKAVAALAWDKPGRGPRPDEEPSPTEMHASAFVWCDSDDAAALARLYERFNEATAGAFVCQALPWEDPEPAGSNEARQRARTTFTRLMGPYAAIKAPAARAAFMNRMVPNMKAAPWFDVETAGLARAYAGAADADKPPLERALGERLGRSPTQSCRRLAVKSVQPLYREQAPGAGDGGTAATEDNEDPPILGLRIAVELAKPEELAPLVEYLCAAGCRLRALPWRPGSTDLQYCY